MRVAVTVLGAAPAAIVATHQAWGGVASVDELAIVGLSGVGIVSAVVALRRRWRDVRYAPDPEARFVAQVWRWAHGLILGVQSALFVHGLLRATQVRPEVLPLPTIVSLYVLPVAALCALGVTVCDPLVRRGVRRLRRREEP